MEFDRDRLAKLAGIRGEDAPTTAAPQAPVRRSEPGGLIREGRAAAARRPLRESAEVQQLRGIIRRETRSVMREMAAERAAIREGNITQLQTRRSLKEAVAMGFYGPGFGDSRQGILGGPIRSRGPWDLSESSYEEGMNPVSEKNSQENLSEAEEMLKALDQIPEEQLKDVAKKLHLSVEELKTSMKTTPDSMMPLLSRGLKDLGVKL